MGSAGLRALVVLSDASCVGRESLHACCEFAGVDALLVKNNGALEWRMIYSPKRELYGHM